MNRSVGKRIIAVIMMLAVSFAFSGCGGDSQGSSDSKGTGSFKVPKFRKAMFNPKKAEGNSDVGVDLSHVSDGYIAVKQKCAGKLKLQVIKDGDQYLYDIRAGRNEYFPLQCGDGTYDIKVMKNVAGTKYFELYGCKADAKIKNEFAPYLIPNQYADYTAGSKCVKLSRKMAKGSSDEKELIKKVYEYICDKIKYDKDKAASVKKGYIPEPDNVLKTGKGICFDYASLAASMLRSMGIPTKIIFGYVEPDDLYHAWNMFYTEEDGWSSVEFEVNPKDWSRIDLTFYANGEDSEFIGDGSNYKEVYQY